MKKSKFLWLLLPLALATATGMYLTSCDKNNLQVLDKNPDVPNVNMDDSNGELTSRTVCTGAEYLFKVVSFQTATSLDFCGDSPNFPVLSSCNFGCNTLGNDKSVSATLDANERKEFCVTKTGSICIRNSSGSTKTVSFQFDSAGIDTVIMANNQVVCFHTNSLC